MREFSKMQAENWAESSINSRRMENRIQFIKESEGAKNSIVRVKPVDYDNTGTIQDSTEWEHGMHQAVQILHDLAITPVSVPSAFTSNYRFFDRHGERMIAFTGTLGSDAELRFQQKLLNAITGIMPPHKESLFKQEKTTFCVKRDDWISEVLNEVNFLNVYIFYW